MYGDSPSPKVSIGAIEAQLKQAHMDRPPMSLQEEVADELAQVHASIIKQEKPVDIFDELRAAQEVFSRACQDYKRAALKRDMANKALCDISAKANALIERALQDPTEPMNQAAMQAGQQVPGNGRW